MYIEGYARGTTLRDLNLIFGIKKDIKKRKLSKPDVIVELPFNSSISETSINMLLDNDTVLANKEYIALAPTRMDKPTIDQIILGLPKEISLAIRGGQVKAQRKVKMAVGALLLLAGYKQMVGAVPSRDKTARYWVPCDDTKYWQPNQRMAHMNNMIDMVPVTVRKLKEQQNQSLLSIV